MGKKQQSLADLVHDAIDRGASTVEEIHRSIAALPLSVLERVELLQVPLEGVRKVQEESIGAVYDTIRRINAEVRRLASEILGMPARKPKSNEKKAAKKRTTKRAAKKRVAAKKRERKSRTTPAG